MAGTIQLPTQSGEVPVELRLPSKLCLVELLPPTGSEQWCTVQIHHSCRDLVFNIVLLRLVGRTDASAVPVSLPWCAVKKQLLRGASRLFARTCISVH